jgi:hypothetical protein
MVLEKYINHVQILLGMDSLRGAQAPRRVPTSSSTDHHHSSDDLSRVVMKNHAEHLALDYDMLDMLHQ